MNKSLKYCYTETTTARQPMCLFRAGTVNHRLASLYHSAYRNEVSCLLLAKASLLWFKTQINFDTVTEINNHWLQQGHDLIFALAKATQIWLKIQIHFNTLGT